MPDIPIVVATDGNPQYCEGLAKPYCEPCVTYGLVIKQRKENRWDAVIRKAIWGESAEKTISTSVIEGYNNKIRQRISRFRRKTAPFTKKIAAYVGTLNIFQFVNNFIDAKKKARRR